MANTHHKKYKKSKGQSYAHNPVDRTLNKTLYQGLQCLHHIGNTQPADSTFGRTLRKKRAELTRFIQPAQNDETFRQVYDGIVSNYLGDTVTLLGNHYKRRLKILEEELRLMPLQHNVSPEQVRIATKIAIKWAKLNFGKKLTVFTLQEFHRWIKQAQRELDSQSVEKTTASTDGDNQEDQPIRHSIPPGTPGSTTDPMAEEDTERMIASDMEIVVTPTATSPGGAEVVRRTAISPPQMQMPSLPTPPLSTTGIPSEDSIETYSLTSLYEVDDAHRTSKAVDHLAREQNQNQEEESSAYAGQDSSTTQAGEQYREPSSTPSMHQPTQDRPNRNGKTGKAGKVTISRIQVDEGTYKLPKVKSEVVYLGDPRIIGLEDTDTKINAKGMSMECYAFVSRARFCEFEKILSQPQKQQTTPRNVILSLELTQPQKRKYHRSFMNLLDLSRKIFPNANIYLPKMNCPYSYLKSEGRAICSENQLRAMRAMNRIIEDAIRDVSFDAKVLPELPQDTKFCVEQNEKKVLWWGAEATSQLVTHWFQHIEK